MRELKNHGFSLYWQQFCALLVKRFIFAKRNKLFGLTQFLIPIGLALLALFTFQNLTKLEKSPDPYLPLTLDIYGDGVHVIYSNKSNDWNVSNQIRSNANQFLQAYLDQLDRNHVLVDETNRSQSIDYEVNF